VILAGDVGGTKCNLALFSEKNGKLTTVFKQRFASKEFASFDLIVKEFSRQAASHLHPDRVIAAGFGVSSPDQLTQMGRFADAVVVGSAVMELVERNPAKAPDVVGQFVRKLLANRRAQYGREL